MNAESIRAVQFREKVRGYHPADVDAFVAAVAQAVEALEQRVKESEAQRTELESRASAGSEAENSLRRTLVLAQRTADAAMDEARQEAARVMAESAQLRAAADADLADLRRRIATEAEAEDRDVRLRLESQRAALLADVEALEDHLGRERERLRIYFADQLRRVEEGSPTISSRPELQAEEPPTPTAAADPVPAGAASISDADEPNADEPNVDEPNVDEPKGDEVGVDLSTPVGGESPGPETATPGAEDDPFLAELRRAVNDSEPLGPREDSPESPPADEPDDGFDLFAKGEDESGRFGSRLRRKR